MYLSKIRVRNYKSFRDSGDIEFKPGINIIVGQNNSGKTALLEALSGKFTNKPHRYKENTLFQGASLAELTLSIDSDELKEIFSKPENRTIVMPQPLDGRIAEAIESLNNCLDSRLNIKIRIDNGELAINTLSHELYSEKTESRNNKNMQLHMSSTMHKFITRDQQDLIAGADIEQTIGYKLIVPFTQGVYRFNAERLNLSIDNTGAVRELNQNASNLAVVLLNTKAHNDKLYERLIGYVSEVLPSVKWVTSVPIDNGTRNEIRVWNVPKETERDDLAISLSECGTGIGQVLAILYVVVTFKEPRTIIIDEPNSFLHPSASKKLIQILNKFPQHQYFISTHSPEILATANPSTLTMLKYEDGETKVEQLDLSQGNDKIKLVSELGMEISDFFFAENILWVEGPTEAKAFPIILQNSKSLFDFVAVPLVHTDDLKDRKRGRKHAKTNIENIRRLSGEYALTPPKIFTVLDREDTSDQEIQDLEKLGIKFIPRRLFENYLLDSEAIASFLQSFEKNITVEEIEDWISKKKDSKEFLDKDDQNCAESEWIKKVHGANLLHQLCLDFSDKTIEYSFDKPKFGKWLASWLLENKPEQLKELQEFLVNLLEEEKS